MKVEFGRSNALVEGRVYWSTNLIPDVRTVLFGDKRSIEGGRHMHGGIG